MTITIELTPELERRLKQEAERRGVPLGECAAQLLRGRLQPPARGRDSWHYLNRGSRAEMSRHSVRRVSTSSGLSTRIACQTGSCSRRNSKG